MSEAARLGEEAARRRPAAATGWHLKGTALAMLRIHGGPDRLAEAEAALDRALELDWSAPSTLENRIRVAKLRGDVTRASELEARLARLERLTR